MLVEKKMEYSIREQNLYERKEKLFASKSYKQWGLSSKELDNLISNNLFHDKVIAMRLILPNETRNLEELYLDYGFCLNRVLDEVQRITMGDYKQMKEHMKKVLEEYGKSQARVHEKIVKSLEHLKEDIEGMSREYKKNIIKQILNKYSMTIQHYSN